MRVIHWFGNGVMCTSWRNIVILAAWRTDSPNAIVLHITQWQCIFAYTIGPSHSRLSRSFSGKWVTGQCNLLCARCWDTVSNPTYKHIIIQTLWFVYVIVYSWKNCVQVRWNDVSVQSCNFARMAHRTKLMYMQCTDLFWPFSNSA